MVAHYGNNNLDLITDQNFSKSSDTLLTISDRNRYIIIKSPIKNEKGKLLGNDFVVFDMKHIINKINSGEISYSIIKSDKTTDSSTNYNNKIVDYRRLLNSDYFLKASISYEVLYSNLYNLTYKIFFAVLITIVIIALILTIYLRRASQNIIDSLKNELKQKRIEVDKDNQLNIYNRKKFSEELKKELHRAERYGTNLSLIMFDVDNFKEINDNYGHNKGDQILQSFVDIVKEEIREHDILARYGGDEFMIIAPETDLNEVENLAKRLLKKINNYSCVENIEPTCSFGVAEFKDGDSFEEFVEKVDKALYRAKEKGRNQVCKNNI